MATYNNIGIYDFEPIVRGNTFNGIEFEIIDDDFGKLDLTNAVYCAQLRRQPYSKVIHEFNVITSGNPLEGVVRFLPLKVEFPAYRYVWDLKITLNNGETYTFIKGDFTVTRDVSNCNN